MLDVDEHGRGGVVGVAVAVDELPRAVIEVVTDEKDRPALIQGLPGREDEAFRVPRIGAVEWEQGDGSMLFAPHLRADA